MAPAAFHVSRRLKVKPTPNRVVAALDPESFELRKVDHFQVIEHVTLISSHIGRKFFHTDSTYQEPDNVHNFYAIALMCSSSRRPTDQQPNP